MAAASWLTHLGAMPVVLGQRRRAASPGSRIDARSGGWNLGEGQGQPRLANGAVFLAADPMQIDTCELGLLEANQDGPTIETERTFVVDTQRYKVRHVFAPKFLDWRGIVKQPVS